MAYTLVEGDTGVVWTVTITDDAVPPVAVNLTNCKVRMAWTVAVADAAGRYSVSAKKTGTMTITDAVNGVATYQWKAGELSPGNMVIEVTVETSAGKFITNPILVTREVRSRIGTLPV